METKAKIEDRPGNNSTIFNLILDSRWFYRFYNNTFGITRVKFVVSKIFGIYNEWECLILGEPQSVGGMYEYQLKLLKIRKYFMGICYKVDIKDKYLHNYDKQYGSK